jgi:hypothetical protein
VERHNYDNDLDFDLDGDGLTTREELMYGLNPLAPDTDGDRIPDGREVSRGTQPGRYDRSTSKNQQEDRTKDREREQLRQQYFECACSVLGWSGVGLSYQTLLDDIGGDEWRGKALDSAVLERAIEQGTEPTEAAYLLAQSPYLQSLKQQGQLEPSQMVGYIEDRLSDCQVLQTASLSPSQAQESEPTDWELERKTD